MLFETFCTISVNRFSYRHQFGSNGFFSDHHRKPEVCASGSLVRSESGYDRKLVAVRLVADNAIAEPAMRTDAANSSLSLSENKLSEYNQ